MVKRFRDMDFDDDNKSNYHQELSERRKDKRIKNALRSKNVKDLLEDYDDYDDED